MSAVDTYERLLIKYSHILEEVEAAKKAAQEEAIARQAKVAGALGIVSVSYSPAKAAPAVKQKDLLAAAQENAALAEAIAPFVYEKTTRESARVSVSKKKLALAMAGAETAKE